MHLVIAWLIIDSIFDRQKLWMDLVGTKDSIEWSTGFTQSFGDDISIQCKLCCLLCPQDWEVEDGKAANLVKVFF